LLSSGGTTGWPAFQGIEQREDEEKSALGRKNREAGSNSGNPQLRGTNEQKKNKKKRQATVNKSRGAPQGYTLTTYTLRKGPNGGPLCEKQEGGGPRVSRKVAQGRLAYLKRDNNIAAAKVLKNWWGGRTSSGLLWSVRQLFEERKIRT